MQDTQGWAWKILWNGLVLNIGILYHLTGDFETLVTDIPLNFKGTDETDNYQ